MTNFEIIAGTAIAQGIFTEEEIDEAIETKGFLPLLTFAEWKKMGFMVQKGQKAIMDAMIWKPRKLTKKEIEALKEAGKEVDENEKKFMKVKAYFFTAEQVEKIQ